MRLPRPEERDFSSYCVTRACFYAAVVVLLLMLAACNRSSESRLVPGEMAPDFVVSDLNGKLVRLSDFRGKLVLLNFWASWCAPCQEEMPGLERLYQSMKDKGFIVLAVALQDSEPALNDFIRQYSLTFPVFLDQDGFSTSDYKIGGFPETFFVSPEGRLLMIPDLADNTPVLRVVGPRVWDSIDSLNRIKSLLDL